MQRLVLGLEGGGEKVLYTYIVNGMAYDGGTRLCGRVRGSRRKMFREEGCKLGWGEGAHQNVVEAQSQEMVAVVAGVVGGGSVRVEGRGEVVHDADYGEAGQQVPEFLEVDNLVFGHVGGHGDEKQVVRVKIQQRMPLGSCVDGEVHGLEQAHQGRFRCVARACHQEQQAAAPWVLSLLLLLAGGFPDGFEVRLQKIGHLVGMELVVGERLQARVDLFYNPQALCVVRGDLIEVALQSIDVFLQFFERRLTDSLAENGIHFKRVPAVSTGLGQFLCRRRPACGLYKTQASQVVSLEMGVEKLFTMQPFGLLELIPAQLPHERCETRQRGKKPLENDLGELVCVPDDKPATVGRPLDYIRVSVALQQPEQLAHEHIRQLHRRDCVHHGSILRGATRDRQTHTQTDRHWRPCYLAIYTNRARSLTANADLPVLYTFYAKRRNKTRSGDICPKICRSSFVIVLCDAIFSDKVWAGEANSYQRHERLRTGRLRRNACTIVFPVYSTLFFPPRPVFSSLLFFGPEAFFFGLLFFCSASRQPQRCTKRRDSSSGRAFCTEFRAASPGRSPGGHCSSAVVYSRLHVLRLSACGHSRACCRHIH